MVSISYVTQSEDYQPIPVLKNSEDGPTNTKRLKLKNVISQINFFSILENTSATIKN